MKLSTLTITALLLAQVPAGAQTKTQPKPVRQASATPKKKQPDKPIKDKARASKDSIKPIRKNPDHYYCPPCGMG